MKVLGCWKLPSQCDQLKTYTARRYCAYGLWGDAIYKELKTMLCRKYGKEYTVVLKECDEDYCDNIELTVPSCELIMGKRSHWASFVHIRPDPRRGTFCLLFDEWRYRSFSNAYCTVCPELEEAEEMVVSTADDLFQRAEIPEELIKEPDIEELVRRGVIWVEK